MEKSTQMGANRTGIDMSPIHSKEMIKGAKELTPLTTPDGNSIATIQSQYLNDASAVGSVPVPGTLRGALKSAMDKMTGHNPEVFLNKLGERLAYERSGVRLYESVIRRCEAMEASMGSSPLPLELLREMRDEEAEHFMMVQGAMESMGADPTAQTPDADVSGVAAMGFQKVLNDPRSSVSQCLEAMLSVELADNAAWELLITLAQDMGMDELADQFGHALRQEEEHVQRVRMWYEQAVRSQASKRSDTQH